MLPKHHRVTSSRATAAATAADDFQLQSSAASLIPDFE